MNKKLNISVIIRVFNRLDDLKICLETIRKHWLGANYFIIVVGNGKALGFDIDSSTQQLSDRCIQLDTNAGHLKGNSQLLQEGMKHIPADSDFTVILEADTWIFSDAVILKYTEKLKREKAVWASANWIEKYHSLALDFALMDSNFLKNNPQIFDFTVHAESFVCNYLRHSGNNYCYMTECMPVHIPSFMRRFYNPFKGRMRSFTIPQMVTHHIEDLPKGMEDKKLQANIMLNRAEFPTPLNSDLKTAHCKLRMIEILMKITPRSRWIKAQKERKL